MEVIVLIITNILAPIITAFATWLMAKRKYNSEVDNNVICNMKESLEFYKQLSDDNRERLSEVLRKNDQLEKEMSDLKTQLLNLTLNICMDLTCKHRILNVKEDQFINKNMNQEENK